MSIGSQDSSNDGHTLKRFQLFEIADQNWCPRFIRRAVTAFLATVASRTRIYLPTGDFLKQALERTKARAIVVLCAGSGGGIADVAGALSPETKITLTDLAPDTSFRSNSPNVAYDPRLVDACNIPADLKGARVIYGSFHHFAPEDAGAILAAAARANEAIAVFEGTERSAKGLAVCLLIPILVLIMMPLTRPLRFLSLLFTYLIPILPLIILWDGIVSTLRSYTQEEMRTLTASLTSYEWNIGTLLGPHQERITYLLGAPGRLPVRNR